MDGCARQTPCTNAFHPYRVSRYKRVFWLAMGSIPPHETSYIRTPAPLRLTRLDIKLQVVLISGSPKRLRNWTIRPRPCLGLSPLTTHTTKHSLRSTWASYTHPPTHTEYTYSLVSHFVHVLLPTLSVGRTFESETMSPDWRRMRQLHLRLAVLSGTYRTTMPVSLTSILGEEGSKAFPPSRLLSDELWCFP